MNYQTFASDESPLRPSQLAKLIACSVQYVTVINLSQLDEGGVAAQTGSLVHLGVAAFHTYKKDKIQAGLAAMQDGLSNFPLADIGDAKRHYSLYTQDPRNINANVVACEQLVKLSLPPHPEDPTGKPVVIQGTLDQIRLRDDGRLAVYDLKTGKTAGWAMIHDYAYQQAAYVLAARASGWPDATPGALIRTWGYRTKEAVLPSPDGVFWYYTITVNDLDFLMERVRLEVARVRSGLLQFGPGPHCTFCPLGGLDRCVDTAKQLYGW